MRSCLCVNICDFLSSFFHFYKLPEYMGVFLGRIYSQQGPVQKKCGPFTYFSSKNWRPFLVITVRVSAVSSPVKLASFFAHHSRSLGGRPLFRYFGHANKSPLFLWGPLFVGAPVRPNMLNMPKSAAGVFNENAMVAIRPIMILRRSSGQKSRSL